MQSFQIELSALCNPSTFLIQLKIKMGTTPRQKKERKKKQVSLVQKWVVSQEAAVVGLTPSPHSFWEHGSFKEYSGRSTGRYLEKIEWIQRARDELEICQRPRCNFRHEREKKVGNASGFLRPGSRFIYSRTERMGHKLPGLLRSVTHLECENCEVGACRVCGEQGSRQKLLSFHLC